MDNLKDVFEHELKDLYSAENQLLKALPKMMKGAQNDELRQAFAGHLEQTQMHVQRLEQVAEMCDVTLRGQKCKGMEGLISEGDSLLQDEDANEARDVALIPAAQRVEHYEIAAYGSAVAFAKLMQLDEAETLLQQTLDEEKQADVKLTEIAEQIVNTAVWDEDDAMQDEAGGMPKNEQAGADGQTGMGNMVTAANGKKTTSSSRTTAMPKR